MKVKDADAWCEPALILAIVMLLRASAIVPFRFQTQ